MGGEISLATTTFMPKAIAFGGGVYLVVGDTFTSPVGTYGIRVDPNGAVLDATPFLIASGRSNPVVASDGSNFLVAFAGLAGVRVGANGQLLDTALLDLTPTGANP